MKVGNISFITSLDYPVRLNQNLDLVSAPEPSNLFPESKCLRSTRQIVSGTEDGKQISKAKGAHQGVKFSITTKKPIADLQKTHCILD